MTEHDVSAVIHRMGWTVAKDECGVHYCIRNLDDRVVQIIPTIGVRADHIRVSFMPSVSTESFSEAVGVIANKGKAHIPIVRMQEQVTKVSTLGEDEITAFLEKIVLWAKAADIANGLEIYRNMPTNSKGAMPLRHIAALALFHDIKELARYRTSFAAGNRMGFANYITCEMLDRAIALSNVPPISGDPT